MTKGKNSQQVAFYQQLGENIRKCRMRRKLSQDALAKLVGLTRTSLTNIEQGRQRPPLHTFCEIVEQLKIDVSELLPLRSAAREPFNLKALAGLHVRGENELAFIETAIGMKGEKPHGNSKKQNPNDGGKAPGR